MTDFASGLTLSARHFPDYSMDKGADGNYVRQELPGTIEFGVELNGVWVPLEKRKAAGLFADLERAKQSQAQTTQTQAPAPETVPQQTTETPPAEQQPQG